jgi:hypothetical protein
MKTRPFGAELFHKNGQTDRHDEANSLFRNFSEVSNKIFHCWNKRESLTET